MIMEFINEFDYDGRYLKWKLLLCVIKGHKGSFTTDRTVSPIVESFHCYRCGATWIKNDKRERIKFYAK